ncbi:hypothetical protein C8R44DRAFT_740077 [Mycena epipterygia]|nr:hypothetical protein C8R44DRAFT_740077 [Mycena epipterygia]
MWGEVTRGGEPASLAVHFPEFNAYERTRYAASEAVPGRTKTRIHQRPEDRPLELRTPKAQGPFGICAVYCVAYACKMKGGKKRMTPSLMGDGFGRKYLVDVSRIMFSLLQLDLYTHRRGSICAGMAMHASGSPLFNLFKAEPAVTGPQLHRVLDVKGGNDGAKTKTIGRGQATASELVLQMQTTASSQFRLSEACPEVISNFGHISRYKSSTQGNILDSISIADIQRVRSRALGVPDKNARNSRILWTNEFQ